MRPSSVIVNVAVDQGGVVETVNRVTSHDKPVYETHGVLHYAVANIPVACSTYINHCSYQCYHSLYRALAGVGFKQAIENDEGLRQGANGLIKVTSLANLFQKD